MRLPLQALALALGAGVLFGAGVAPTSAQAEGTFTITSMTPDTAVKLAQAALKSCRDKGYQVTVAVVDRGGNVQALIRDRFAGPHTPDTAIGKAWTAVSFRTNTTDMAANTQSGKPQSGTRHIPGALMLGGGMIVEAGGGIIGGVGVSGAPGGDLDDACAADGIDAISGDLM